MPNYLIHFTRDGEPVGVWTENDHYYFPSKQQHEEYGKSVIEARGTSVPWEDFADQLAFKTPAPTAMWDTVDHPSAPLYQILVDVRDSAT